MKGASGHNISGTVPDMGDHRSGARRYRSSTTTKCIGKWTKWMFTALVLSFDTGVLIVSAGIQGKGSGNRNSLGTSTHFAPSMNQPQFEPVPKNVTALIGKSAYLTCKVKNLGNKSVSWIRHRDLHILTVGSYTYTSDQRFQTTHHKETSEWTLQIKWSQLRDAGMYECQISTQPVKSYFVNLNVAVPTAAILGGPDLHVDIGSTINLTCSIRFSPEPPAYIFWYHEDEVISQDSTRGGISIITEKGDITSSRLLIQHADQADSGKYSCSPSNAEVANIRVHILDANRPDIVLVDHSKNTTYIVDVTIPHDENLQKAERDKILKYMDLAHEIKDMWRTPATIVVPIVISTNGLIPKNLHDNLCKVGVDGGLKYLMQKAVLLSTCRTLRERLEAMQTNRGAVLHDSIRWEKMFSVLYLIHVTLWLVTR